MIIVEIGGDPAVGFAGRFLSLLGHRVIKIEFLPGGDETRSRPPQYLGQEKDESSGILFHYLNQGKQSVAIDLDEKEGQSIVKQLSHAAQAVIVDATSLNRKHVNELIEQLGGDVVTVVSPFGLDGPYSRFEATSGTIFAISGEASMLPGGIGYQLNPDGPPLLARGHVADGDTGVIATLVTLAGLLHYANDKTRVSLDVTKQEAETSLNRWLVTHFRASGWIESRATRAYSYGGLTQCADGFVQIQPATDKHWQSIVNMLGKPKWSDSPELATQEDRAANGSLIQEHLAKWALSKSKSEVFEAGMAVGLPVAPVQNVADVASSDQYRARQYFVPASDVSDSPLELAGVPFRPHPSTQASYTSAPDLGEHTRQVLLEFLNLSNDQIRDLESRAIIKCNVNVVRH
jgi:CoA:oxalate CoA-transferase